jgi:hypothetical protein
MLLTEGRMHVERRRKRSSFAGLALQYWLNAIAQKKRLFALVVSDSAGLLIASSLHGPEAEELAAIAPLLGRSGEDGMQLDRPDIPVVVHKLQVDHSSLYLCAVGDRARGQESVRLAAGGVRRILTAQA